MIKLFPALVLSVALLILSWVISRNGSLTFTVIIPQGVRVHIDNPQVFSQPINTPQITKQSSPQPLPMKSLSEPQHSILNAITALSHYLHTTQEIIARKRTRFERLPAFQRPLAHAIGYDAHFSDAQASAEVNAGFMSEVANYARELYGFADWEEANEVRYEIADDLMGHLVRDWTEDGAAERAQIFPPIFDALRTGLLPSNPSDKMKILVPGFGMGRLAHEIANNQAYEVDACELDYGSVIGYHYLLNSTSSLFQHTLYPFATSWTHQRTRAARFRALQLPDMLPTSPVNLIEGDFLTEFPQAEQYDAIVTMFFIDVSENIIDFLSNIHRLLKPGGLWINLGPFKWGTWSQMQLSAEETIELAELLGFDVDHDSRKSIDTVYAHQPESLLKFTYVTQFWTARKRL